MKDPTHAAFKEKMKEFMSNFDKNSDGRIEMTEVRKISFLPEIHLDDSVTRCAGQPSISKSQ